MMSMRPMKVIVALDDSAHSEYALESVMERPWADGTEFLILSVFEPYHPDFAGWDAGAVEQAVRYARGLEEQVKKYVANCASKLSQCLGNAKVSCEAVENARIKETIIQKAIHWQADLIIMGSHGRSGIERFLLGSVSQAVISHSPCSVEIIKRPQRHSSN